MRIVDNRTKKLYNEMKKTRKRYKMKLSVIICLYNTKKELVDKCLNSICTSTLEDYEVVLVDDGSNVDYSDIIEKYHPVYVKTENRGQLAARTYGLMLAKGDYVAYLDSDDSVTFNYHNPMVEKGLRDGADIVINDWAFRTSSCCAYCESDSTINSELCIEGDEILNQFAKYQGRQHSYYVLWNKIFKRELLLRAKAEIEKTDAIMKKQTYSEDVLMTFFAFKHAKKLVNIHTGYYLYHIHEGQSVSVDTSEKIRAQVDMITKNFAIMLDSIGDNIYKEAIKENIIQWKAMAARTHFSCAKGLGDLKLMDYIKEQYGQEKVTLSKARDSRDYIASGLLGNNFEGIDAVLRWIYKKGGDVSIKYNKRDKYVADSIGYIEKQKGIRIESSENAQVTVPKRKKSLKSRILHSRIVLKTGLVLFPKGSKLRNVLKRKL